MLLMAEYAVQHYCMQDVDISRLLVELVLSLCQEDNKRR
jgi:hypothetical protein